MVRLACASLLLLGTASAELLGDVGDILAFLATLGPAPEGDARFTNWTPPGPNDVRSPCPGLNTLANHGFIHHDGKDMTIPHLLEGLAAGMNMGADFTVAIGAAGLFSAPFPLAGSFDLNQLDQHDFPIEHDASLSRQDAYFGNDYSFNQSHFDQVISFYQPNGTYTSLLPAANSLANRTEDSYETNPEFIYGLREFIFRYGETAIYLQAMGSNDVDGVTRVDWVKSLFEEEKLPYELGWRPRAEPVTLLSLGNMVFDLITISPEKFSEGGNITADSYKDVFELLVGGSEALNNLTSGISSVLGL